MMVVVEVVLQQEVLKILPHVNFHLSQQRSDSHPNPKHSPS